MPCLDYFPIRNQEKDGKKVFVDKIFLVFSFFLSLQLEFNNTLGIDEDWSQVMYDITCSYMLCDVEGLVVVVIVGGCNNWRGFSFSYGSKLKFSFLLGGIKFKESARNPLNLSKFKM